MNQPRPESRISALEKRASTLEAQVEELSSDTDEHFRALRQTMEGNFTELKQDIKQLADGIKASYVSIGDTFIAMGNDIKASVATKEDLAALKASQDEQGAKLDLILQLLQQKPDK
jgi:archaellum component FlaC